MHGSAVTIPPANSLGLGSNMCSKHFALNNTCRFYDYFFSVYIKKEKSIFYEKMHKIESIQTGEKNIGTFYCAFVLANF